MYIEDITKIDKDAILSNALFDEIFSIDDEFEKAKILLSIEERAKIIDKKTEFNKLLRAYTKKKKAEVKANQSSGFNEYQNSGMTSFSGGDYQDYNCGQWVANDNGVCLYTPLGMKEACSHPIMPIQILTNAETGFCKINLAYKLKNRWKEIVVDKEIISSSSKIVSLSRFGIRVNSENAKNLVSYLTDMEAMNEDSIKEQVSTSKLGWINDEFMPYGENIVFDSESSLKTIFESIKEDGSREEWYRLIKQIRKDGKFENKIYLVGSFASVLVKLVNALPFVVNLYGETGKGKTVAMMMAASVWANPSEGCYLSDAKSTPTALEMKLNFLNNMPMFLDDMAQIKSQYHDDFTQLVYLWCSGTGKARSNRNLGLNASTSWKNIILTNAERSLLNDTASGGAINRIIDVEMQDGYLFENGNQTVEILKNNYGHAGREFIELIQSMDNAEIKKIQQGFYNRILGRAKKSGKEKEEKQVLPMSILLTADYLINKHLFKDDCTLDFETCFNILKNKNEVSENIRAYNFLIDEIQMNASKFVKKKDEFSPIECWGIIEEDAEYAVINGNAFKKMSEKGNFSQKGFFTWAIKNKYIEPAKNGDVKRQTRIGNVNARCVYLKIKEDDNSEMDEFVPVPKDGDIPFDIS